MPILFGAPPSSTYGTGKEYGKCQPVLLSTSQSMPNRPKTPATAILPSGSRGIATPSFRVVEEPMPQLASGDSTASEDDLAYIHFTGNEADRVDYVMDDDDELWLQQYNKQSGQAGETLSSDTLEEMMDTMEKRHCALLERRFAGQIHGGRPDWAPTIPPAYEALSLENAQQALPLVSADAVTAVYTHWTTRKAQNHPFPLIASLSFQPPYAYVAFPGLSESLPFTGRHSVEGYARHSKHYVRPEEALHAANQLRAVKEDLTTLRPLATKLTHREGKKRELAAAWTYDVEQAMAGLMHPDALEPELSFAFATSLSGLESEVSQRDPSSASHVRRGRLARTPPNRSVADSAPRPRRERSYEPLRGVRGPPPPDGTERDDKCFWCKNEANCVGCSACPRSFCFKCFKRRPKFGINNWSRALKDPEYVCAICRGVESPESEGDMCKEYTKTDGSQGVTGATVGSPSVGPATASSLGNRGTPPAALAGSAPANTAALGAAERGEVRVGNQIIFPARNVLGRGRGRGRKGRPPGPGRGHKGPMKRKLGEEVVYVRPAPQTFKHRPATPAFSAQHHMAASANSHLAVQPERGLELTSPAPRPHIKVESELYSGPSAPHMGFDVHHPLTPEVPAGVSMVNTPLPLAGNTIFASHDELLDNELGPGTFAELLPPHQTPFMLPEAGANNSQPDVLADVGNIRRASALKRKPSLGEMNDNDPQCKPQLKRSRSRAAPFAAGALLQNRNSLGERTNSVELFPSGTFDFNFTFNNSLSGSPNRLDALDIPLPTLSDNYGSGLEVSLQHTSGVTPEAYAEQVAASSLSTGNIQSYDHNKEAAAKAGDRDRAESPSPRFL